MARDTKQFERKTNSKSSNSKFILLPSCLRLHKISPAENGRLCLFYFLFFFFQFLMVMMTWQRHFHYVSEAFNGFWTSATTRRGAGGWMPDREQSNEESQLKLWLWRCLSSPWKPGSSWLATFWTVVDLEPDFLDEEFMCGSHLWPHGSLPLSKTTAYKYFGKAEIESQLCLFVQNLPKYHFL